MKYLLAVLFLISVAGTAFPVSSAYAQTEITSNDELIILLAQNQKKLTESEAAKRAQKQYGGKVVSVVCKEQDDRVYCSVRLDIDGRIKTVTIRG